MKASGVFVVVALAILSAPVAAYAAGCTVYQHRDYEGPSYHLNHNEEMVMTRRPELGVSTSHGPRTYYTPSWNDKVSSFKVTTGCTITLYQHINREGSSWEATTSYRYVGKSWNDQTSQVTCYCRR